MTEVAGERIGLNYQSRPRESQMKQNERYKNQDIPLEFIEQFFRVPSTETKEGEPSVVDCQKADFDKSLPDNVKE